MKRYVASVTVAIAIVLLAAGSAFAHPVGEPGSPSCFGERISHGSSDHGLTPVERAELLGEVVAAELANPETPPEFRELLLSLFGDDGVSVKEMTNFVRIMCTDPLF